MNIKEKIFFGTANFLLNVYELVAAFIAYTLFVCVLICLLPLALIALPIQIVIDLKEKK